MPHGGVSGHFLGIPWIDISPKAAIAEVERYCVSGLCKGLLLEPGLYTPRQ